MLDPLGIITFLLSVVAGLFTLRVSILGFYRILIIREGGKADLEEFQQLAQNGDMELRLMNLYLKAGLNPDRRATTKKGDTALLIAARSGQEQTVRLFLQKRSIWKFRLRKGADPARTNYWHFTPITAAVLGDHEGVQDALLEAGLPIKALAGPKLLRAAQRGELEEVRRLIEKAKPDEIETITDDGSTPLITAARRPGNNKTVRALLEAGAMKNARNRFGRTALMAASEGDAVDCAQVLIDFGVNLEAVDNDEDRETAYIIAVRYGHGGIIKLLKDAGANTALPPDLAPKFDFQDALNRKLFDKVQRLFAEISNRPAFDPNMRLPDGRTLLQALIDAGAKEEARKLVEERGADPNLLSEDGTTPVQTAVSKEDAETARTLVRAGAKTDVRTKEGESLLGAAVGTESSDLVEALLEGSDINQRSRDGSTPLLIAVQKGNLPLVELLLNRKPKVDAANHLGATPLMAAVLDQNQPIVNLLCAAGAKRGKSEALLILAATQGDIAEVRRLIEEGADTNIVGSRGRSAVLEAVRHDRRAVLDYLLSLDPTQVPDLEQTDMIGNTPLMIAATMGNLEITKRLIQAGSRLQARRTDGHTALMLACRHGQTAVVRQLVEDGARIDFVRRDGRNALILAVNGGHTAITELLIKYGADVNTISRRGESALMLAILRGDSKMIDLLKRNGAKRGMAEAELFIAARHGDTVNVNRLLNNETPVDARVGRGKTPLLEAIDNNRLNVVQLLTAAGADINDTEWKRTTPLLRAASKGHIGIVKHLISQGASANKPGQNGQTPLLAACQIEHSGIVKVLINAGANVNAADNHGRTPLMTAILKENSKLIVDLRKKGAIEGESSAGLIMATRIGNLAQVKHWLANGANVNALGLHRESPLLEACRRGAYNIAAELLKQGADTNRKSTAGITPLFMAAAGQNPSLIDLLVVNNADLEATSTHGRTPIMVAAEEGRETIDPAGKTVLGALLRNGSNVNASDSNGDTALILAAAAGKLVSIQTLLDVKEIAIDAAGKRRRTALMAAALNGHGDVVKTLLAAGSAIDAKDVNDSTALILAVPTLKEGVIKMLLKAGANPNARDTLGNTPLMEAMLADEPQLSERIIELLRDFGAEEGEAEVELIAAAAACDNSKINQLLVKRVKVDARRPGEDPAIVLAAWSNCRTADQEKVIKALVKFGADVTLKGRWGRTALMGVAQSGNKDLVKTLLNSGAGNVIEAVKDQQNLMTLHTATTLAAAEGKEEIVNLLAEHNALRPKDSVLLLEHGEKYHLSGCAFVRSGADEVTLVKALKERRRPCRFCLPKQ